MRIGGAAIEWNNSRREATAKRQEELARIQLQQIEAERAEKAKPVPCPFCGEPVSREAKKCRHCNEYLDPSYRPAVPQVVINNVNTNTVQAMASATSIVGGYQRKRFSRIVAFVLSVLIPGLGQLYTGRFLAGAIWFILVVIGYAIFIFPGLILHVLCAVSAGMTNPYR